MVTTTEEGCHCSLPQCLSPSQHCNQLASLFNLYPHHTVSVLLRYDQHFYLLPNIVISKRDLFSAVDLFHSALTSKPRPYNHTPPYISSSGSFGSSNAPPFSPIAELDEDSAPLTPAASSTGAGTANITCGSRLRNLLSMLSEDGMCASTDEELLDGEEWSSATHKPPPVPPRTKSVTSIGSIEESDNPGHPDNVLPHPPKSGNAVDSVVLSSPPVVPPKRHAWAHTVSESAISNSFSPPVSSHPAASVPLRAPKPPVSPRTKSPKPNTGASSSSISGLSSSAPSTHGIRSTSELHKSKSEYNIKLPQYSTKFFEGDSDDSDSSDDFEHFEPPKRSRYSSEPFVHQQILHCQMRERRLSSPAPQKPLNKSSPILTKRPGWYPKPDKQALQRKYNSEISFQSLSGAATLHGQVQHRQDTSSSSRRAKARSRSLDDKTRSSVSRKSSVGNLSINPIHGTIAALKHSQSCDSDDCTGGTIDSTGYSKPFEHILWRKLGLEDGSALSGSMPHLTQLCNELDSGVGGTGCDGGASEAEEGGEGEEGEECTYLDPTELEEYCKKLGGNKELTARVRTRMSTVLCKTYLTLQNVASITGKDASTTKTPSENRSFVVSSGFLSPPLPSGCPKPPYLTLYIVIFNFIYRDI